jgi:beta-glucosidase
LRLVQAHKRVYNVIHTIDPDAMVSSNVACIPAVNRLVDLGFLDWVTGSLDFVGIDYYYDVRRATSPPCTARPGRVAD